MKNLPLLFCGIFFTLAFSFTGIVLTSHLQFGSLTQSTETLEDDGEGHKVMPEGEAMFPRKEGGLALQGKQVYIEMGCIYCHSQQLRREGYGADMDRAWGPRATVARDYITQQRVLLGSMRTGPDLANIGGRLAVRSWHHQHLYNPAITSDGKSNMPPFPFSTRCRRSMARLLKMQSTFLQIPNTLLKRATKWCRHAAPKPSLNICSASRSTTAFRKPRFSTNERRNHNQSRPREQNLSGKSGYAGCRHAGCPCPAHARKG